MPSHANQNVHASYDHHWLIMMGHVIIPLLRLSPQCGHDMRFCGPEGAFLGPWRMELQGFQPRHIHLPPSPSHRSANSSWSKFGMLSTFNQHGPHFLNVLGLWLHQIMCSSTTLAPQHQWKTSYESVVIQWSMYGNTMVSHSRAPALALCNRVTYGWPIWSDMCLIMESSRPTVMIVVDIRCYSVPFQKYLPAEHATSADWWPLATMPSNRCQSVVVLVNHSTCWQKI